MNMKKEDKVKKLKKEIKRLQKEINQLHNRKLKLKQLVEKQVLKELLEEVKEIEKGKRKPISFEELKKKLEVEE